MTDFLVQDLVNVRNYANIFKRITRYTIKPIGIIVDRHSPPPTGEPTVDPDGEWMKCDQLNSIIAMGGLLEFSEPLNELLMDGKAQQALMRDIGNLGYESFDQVMELLKTQRHGVLTAKDYTIWTEGFHAQGNESKAQFHAIQSAYSFHEAVEKFVAGLSEESRKTCHYDSATNTWTMWGCKFFEDEAEARKSFG